MDICTIFILVITYLLIGAALGALADGGGWTMLIITLFWPIFIVAIIICLWLGIFY